MTIKQARHGGTQVGALLWWRFMDPPVTTPEEAIALAALAISDAFRYMPGVDPLVAEAFLDSLQKSAYLTLQDQQYVYIGEPLTTSV